MKTRTHVPVLSGTPFQPCVVPSGGSLKCPPCSSLAVPCQAALLLMCTCTTVVLACGPAASLVGRPQAPEAGISPGGLAHGHVTPTPHVWSLLDLPDCCTAVILTLLLSPLLSPQRAWKTDLTVHAPHCVLRVKPSLPDGLASCFLLWAFMHLFPAAMASFLWPANPESCGLCYQCRWFYRLVV